jgi:hypothetical protein
LFAIQAHITRSLQLQGAVVPKTGAASKMTMFGKTLTADVCNGRPASPQRPLFFWTFVHCIAGICELLFFLSLAQL